IMATLRSFIALLLNRAMAGARSRRKTGTHFSGSRSKTWNLRAHRAQKGSPAKRTGQTLRVATQYSQKSPENNALFAIWLADFRSQTSPASAAVGLLRWKYPATHFLERGFDGFVSPASPRPQRLSGSDHGTTTD